MKISGYLLLGLCVVSLSPPAVAQPYAGLGLSRVDSSSSTGADTGDANGVMLYGGNRIDHFGFEFVYVDVGDIDVPNTTIVTSGNLFKVQACGFAGLSPGLDLMAKLGVAIPDIKTNSGWSYNDTEFAWSVGMNYQFSQRYGFRVEYEQYADMDGLDLDLLTFSLNQQF